MNILEYDNKNISLSQMSKLMFTRQRDNSHHDRTDILNYQNGTLSSIKQGFTQTFGNNLSKQLSDAGEGLNSYREDLNHQSADNLNKSDPKSVNNSRN